jgi:hypothetical protein
MSSSYTLKGRRVPHALVALPLAPTNMRAKMSPDTVNMTVANFSKPGHLASVLP